MYYYSAKNNGFYHSTIFGSMGDKGFSGPSDCVEVSDEERAELASQEGKGKVITAGKNGRPVAIDKIDTLTDEEKSKFARLHRDELIASTDWVVMRHRDEKDIGADQTISEDTYKALLEYRSDLRKITAEKGFPDKIKWPESPL